MKEKRGLKKIWRKEPGSRGCLKSGEESDREKSFGGKGGGTVHWPEFCEKRGRRLSPKENGRDRIS